MRKLQLILALLAISTISYAQSFTISGHVRDSMNGEDLIGAVIRVKSGGGAVSNEYGFY